MLQGKKSPDSVNLLELDKHLSQYSYVGGYMPSKNDIEMIKNIKSDVDFNTLKHIKRWLDHMRSFNDSEIILFPVINTFNHLLMSETTVPIEQQVCVLKNYNFHCKIVWFVIWLFTYFLQLLIECILCFWTPHMVVSSPHHL